MIFAPQLLQGLNGSPRRLFLTGSGLTAGRRAA